MFPALMSLAVARVDETERGAVVGTTTAFLDLSFGLSPAILGLVAGAGGYGGDVPRLRGGRRSSAAVLLVARARRVVRHAGPPRRGTLAG